MLKKTIQQTVKLSGKTSPPFIRRKPIRVVGGFITPTQGNISKSCFFKNRQEYDGGLSAATEVQTGWGRHSENGFRHPSSGK